MCPGLMRVADGRRARDEITLSLPDGELVLSGPGMPDGSQDAAVLIPSRIFVRAAGQGHLALEYLTKCLAREGSDLRLQFHVAGLQPVQNLVENLLTLLRAPGNAPQALPEATLALLLLQLMGHLDALDTTPLTPRQAAVLSALREIEENSLSADLTRLSEMRGLSLPYLSSAVHSAMGRTFKELLLDKRLSQAARLLEDTDLPVDEVIAAIGYDNTSYFYRKFREKYGASPKEYRARMG